MTTQGIQLPSFLRVAAERQKHSITNRNGEKFKLEAPSPSSLVYVQDCKDCECELQRKAMKVIVEGCKDCVFNIDSTLITGMIEVLNCENFTINVNENGAIMTLTVDGSKNVKVNALRSDQFDSIYSHRSSGMEVVVGKENPTKLAVVVDEDPDRQYIVHWEKEGDSVKLICDKVIRDGIYPTTEKQLAETIAKEREMSERMAAMMVDGMKVTQKPKKSKASVKQAEAQSQLPKNKPQPKPTKPQATNPPNKIKPPSKPKPQKPSKHKPKPKPQAKPSKHRPAPNIEEDDDKKEFFESEEDLTAKLDTLCQWIKDSKHCIVFTGAGISTSTGIRDFRSGMNTVLKTGPGKCELQAKGATKSSLTKVNVLKAVPSVAHMVLVKLHQEGLVKFTVNQNTDGLHLRSGIPADQLAELHGNTNLEKCTKCGAKYLRDFRTRNAQGVHKHRTGRFCDNFMCRGHLVDSIINFGEDLPEDDLDRAFDEAGKSDLCIVLGSSLRVTPAADVPESVMEKGGKLVICNLQKTPLNDGCALEIHKQIDDVMVGLATRLGLEIPQFTVKRRLAVMVTEKDITIQGLDVALDTPYSFMRQVEVKLMQKHDGKYKEIVKEVLTKEPYSIAIPKMTRLSPQNPVKGEICLGLQGHYGEPDFTLPATIDKPGRTVYLLSYNLCDGTWNVEDLQ
ncbi:uncharacterized protein LOC116300405 [Actinia tenebrosa]|uniref:Uncharacterized protein LOC116300405 n=1 Tax=Actinia tenebrosa TaxID=6105 RepID=A0A6P8IF20_ACTTE|nr:uncharacterized protein LOC116300405 [Actinia tenebrosa]XP_031565140.1 uncharacterized protein LOC116300405 [Actinia tenebrosa]